MKTIGIDVPRCLWYPVGQVSPRGSWDGGASKNLFVGIGTSRAIQPLHFIGAIHGMEETSGRGMAIDDRGSGRALAPFVETFSKDDRIDGLIRKTFSKDGRIDGLIRRWATLACQR
ncbi:hypothetical protein ACHAW5_004894 [Stephanodiscus triporus]|uniref:Uncharacterized protein n=1 Tax=Stephanodiscus triporus TaxID=2934178 RepID=A0ABD3PUA9_9STRA